MPHDLWSIYTNYLYLLYSYKSHHQQPKSTGILCNDVDVFLG